MRLTKRELRVINAFLVCIRSGEYSEAYAITLIEDNARYGWLTDAAKDYFYEELDKMHPEPEPEPEPNEEDEPMGETGDIE